MTRTEAINRKSLEVTRARGTYARVATSGIYWLSVGHSDHEQAEHRRKTRLFEVKLFVAQKELEEIVATRSSSR